MNFATVENEYRVHQGRLGLFALEYVEWDLDLQADPPVKREVGRYSVIVSTSGHYSSRLVDSFASACAELDIFDAEVRLAKQESLDAWKGSCKLTEAEWRDAFHLKAPSLAQAATLRSAPLAIDANDLTHGL
ncbi:hypothetical protein ACVWWJ_002670 [Luteibacter sp. HA06]